MPVLPQGPIFTDELFDLVFSFHGNKVFVWVINWGVSVEKEDIKIFLKFIYLLITSLYYILLFKISVSKFSSFFSQRHNCKKIIQVYSKALISKIEYKMINNLFTLGAFVKNTIAPHHYFVILIKFNGWLQVGSVTVAHDDCSDPVLCLFHQLLLYNHAPDGGNL